MQLRALSLAVLATFAVGSIASAAIYTDATSEVAVPGNPFPHIDISSVEVTNTATDITFKINVVGNPISTNWGKYCIGIDTGAGGSTGNGWARPISMAGGMDAWVGSWVNGGNTAQPWVYSGSWAMNATVTPVVTSSSVSYTFPFASLGLSLGQTILFDAYTTGGGGGDGAVDALSAAGASISNWGDSFTSSAPPSYTIAIPEPATLGVIAGAGLLALRRRK